MTYDLTPLEAPRTAGNVLRLLARLADSDLIGGLLAKKFLRDIGVEAMRAAPAGEAAASVHPLLDERPPRTGADPVPPMPDFDPPTSPFDTAADFVRAYRDQRLSPLTVAERVINWARTCDALQPAMRIFIAQDEADLMRQAGASADRYGRSAPLGPLDGVPVPVKDELDQAPYGTTVGTSFLGRNPVGKDAEVVARLRAAGALLVGKTNMQELGLGVTGLNAHHGAARNPYDPRRATGGSSSGPAAAVAAGFGPIALGADGGGSIRIPAAFCGVVGLKCTFGRVSEHGAAPLCWSLAHVGPIAATVRDCALAYACIAGPDRRDRNTFHAPPATLDALSRPDLRGVTLGIYREWFDDADPEVVAVCHRALEGLKAAGAEVRALEIPNLALMRTVHLVTIVSEMAASQVVVGAGHRGEYGPDTRLNLALGGRLLSSDYVHAQRLRAKLHQQFMDAMRGVDALMTPATGCVAPIHPLDALAFGESDLAKTDRIMRYAVAANLTGQPAISFPAGYVDGMPVGLQAIGQPWTEDLLLRIAAAAEGFVERRLPRVHRSLLGDR